MRTSSSAISTFTVVPFLARRSDVQRAEEAGSLVARPDFVCLDIMMPGHSGYDVCRELRRGGSNVPIVFISAKSEEIDKVLALELGGDDFIVKPFGVKEVVARIRAVTRRCLAVAAPAERRRAFVIGDLEVLPTELRARRGQEWIELSLREVKLLGLFAQHRGEVLDRNTIFDQCWGDTFFPQSRTLDQHIAKLRKKIERDQKNPVIIRTVHGVGYRYDG
jgi:two-component system alkaline phosphatase synthesis response regulator PhoP